MEEGAEVAELVQQDLASSTVTWFTERTTLNGEQRIIMAWAFTAAKAEDPESSPGKKRKGSGGEAGSSGEAGARGGAVMRDVVQLTLQNTRGLAHVEHVLYKTWEVQADVSFIKTGLAAGRGYNEATKGRAGHKFGSPGAHVAVAVIKEIRTKISLKEGQDACDNLLAQCTSPQTTETLIPVFFLAKCHSGKTYKMVWHDKTTDKVLTTILEEALKEAGAEEKEGTRPRNPAERRLRSWLQKVEGVY